MYVNSHLPIRLPGNAKLAKQVFQDNIKEMKSVEFSLPIGYILIIHCLILLSTSDKENKPDDKNVLGSSLKKPMTAVPTGKQTSSTSTKIPKMTYITKDELEETPKY